MTYVNYSAFVELKNNYVNINVVDVGAARASFLVELEKIFNLNDVYAIGIDPFDHNVKGHYDKFFQICVDNVDSPTKKKFFVNIK